MTVEKSTAVDGSRTASVGRGVVVPTAGVAFAVLMIAASLVLVFVGAVTTGVSWDEPWRVGALNNFLDYGWFVDKVEGGRPVGDSTYVYAPLPDLFTHAIGVLTGAQDWGQAEVTAAAYAARHVGIGLLSVLGLAAAGSIVGVLLASWRWAVVAAAILASLPVWTGHAMFNGSDMPVAVGYTTATLSAVLLARAAATESRPRVLVVASLLLAFGIVLSVGTRPATWPALVVTCLLPLVGAPIIATAGARGRQLLRTGAAVGGAVLVGTGALVLAYPAVFGNPLQALVSSVSQSASFGVDPGSAPSSGDGPSLMTALGYLPSWLVIQLPIVAGCLFVVGLVAGAVILVRILSRKGLRRELLWVVVASVAILAQLGLLPIGAAVARSNVYDGVRQFLFIVPMIAVIASIGLWSAVRAAGRAARGRRALTITTWVLVGVGVVLPIVDQLRLFPYGYAYVNEAAAREPIDGRLPTDYWRTSMRELIPLIPATGDTACNFDPLILGLVPIDCANQGQLSPFWDTRGSEGLGIPVPVGKYVYLETNRGRVDPGPGCSIVDTVTRTLHGQEVTMSYVAICEAPCVVEEAAQCAGKSLSGANLDGWNLRGSNFAGADLTGTSLILADLSGANLTGADLTGAVLASANLAGADLTGADLTGANLDDVNLEGATLTGVIGLPGTPAEG